MKDITNYAYIWYNEASPLSAIPSTEDNTIFQIVSSFSYPCYLANKGVNSLSPDKRYQLLHDEIGFIRDIMDGEGLRHVKIVQIPRVLYDLLNLIYLIETKSKLAGIIISCKDEDDDTLDTYESYSASANSLLSKDGFNSDILQLNTFILNKIGYIVGGGEPPDKYSSSITKKSVSTSPMKMTDSFNNDIRLFLSDRNKACVSVLEHILKAEHIYDGGMVIEGIKVRGTIYVNLLYPEIKNFFRQVLRFELQESSGYTTLYRGSVLEDDSLLRYNGSRGSKGRKFDLQSVSFNASVLSGCINDHTACTLYYMESISTFDAMQALTRSYQNDKVRYSLKKFLKGDNSSEDSLFFIPPLHPFLQLHTEGELFHPRTKVSRGDIQNKNVRGLFCSNKFVRQCDYLQSDKSMIELDALYQRFKATGIIDKWYTKPNEQKQYEDTRKARVSAVRETAARGKERLRALKKKAKVKGESTPRKSPKSPKSPNKQMRVLQYVDKLHSGGQRIRTRKIKLR